MQACLQTGRMGACWMQAERMRACWTWNGRVRACWMQAEWMAVSQAGACHLKLEKDGFEYWASAMLP